MKNIIIVGASGLGREVLEWIKDINEVSPRWKIKGFIDDNLAALDSLDSEFRIIGFLQKKKCLYVLSHSLELNMRL